MLLLISSKMGTLHPMLLKLRATELFENKQTKATDPVTLCLLKRTHTVTYTETR